MKNKTWNIAILKGDGVGPEVIDAAISVLDSIKDSYGIHINYRFAAAGFNCIEKYGTNLPQNTIKILKDMDCVLKGPMTTPETPGTPVSAAVQIRKMFDLYANIRPAKNIKGVSSFKTGVDLVIVRENTEGMYSGKELMINDDTAIGMRIITRKATERIARFAFELAMKRKKHLTYVHKQNILKLSDGLFNDVILSVGNKFKKVHLDGAHIDAMAQWLIKQPENYDVIVTENLFGDILSDESAMLVGGMGIAPGANIGDNYAMFEPVHGSVPKYAGKDKVNPIATVRSIKMMLDWMGFEEEALTIEKAIGILVNEKDTLTYDLGGNAKCSQVGDRLAEIISKISIH